jgi:uncharacterized protein (DUF736 family)
MENKTNTGAIFKNDKKTNPNQPDYRGKVNVNGKEMEIALWVKTSSAGNTYFSASFSEPYVAPTNNVVSNVPVNDQINDDLPF